MVVAVYDENLMWSARLRLTLQAAGHTALLPKPGALPTADVAIVNLGSKAFPADQLVPDLKGQGTKIIAHAGRKEKPLLTQGNELGCDLVVSNSTITNQLVKLLDQVTSSPE